MVEMRDIVSKLSELTGQNRVPWKAISDDSSFIAEYGDLSVVIASFGNWPRESILLTIHDANSNIIDSARYEGNSELLRNKEEYNFPELKLLYESAKRSALDVDEQLGTLLERMEANPPVHPQ